MVRLQICGSVYRWLTDPDSDRTPDSDLTPDTNPDPAPDPVHEFINRVFAKTTTKHSTEPINDEARVSESRTLNTLMLFFLKCLCKLFFSVLDPIWDPVPF